MSETFHQVVHPYMQELDSLDRDAASVVSGFTNVEKERILHLAKELHKVDPSALDTSDAWETLSEITQAHYIYIALRVRHGILYQVDKKFIL